MWVAVGERDRQIKCRAVANKPNTTATGQWLLAGSIVHRSTSQVLLIFRSQRSNAQHRADFLMLVLLMNPTTARRRDLRARPLLRRSSSQVQSLRCNVRSQARLCSGVNTPVPLNHSAANATIKAHALGVPRGSGAGHRPNRNSRAPASARTLPSQPATRHRASSTRPCCDCGLEQSCAFEKYPRK